MLIETTFLGRGWAFPPTFTRGGGEVAMVADEADVLESLRILLATRPGERTMQQHFGCDLGGLLFEELDQGLVNALQGTVKDAILYHEPRIDLDRVDVLHRNDEAGLIRISIHFTVRATNSRYNMVYPFYLDEATFLT